MNDQNATPETTTESSEQSLSPWWKLQGIFLEPTRTFKAIDRNPNWVIPLLLLCLISVAANVYVVNTIGYENLVRQQLMQSSQIQQLDPDQREEIIAQQARNPFFRYIQYFAPVFTALFMLVLATLLFLGLMLIGSESKFVEVFSVACHSFFAYSLISSILLVIVVSLAADKSAIDIQNAVQSNLGMLFDRSESPLLFTLASSIDLLTFYCIYLLALGLSIVAVRTSFSATLCVVGVLWLIWVGIKVAGAAIMG